MPIIQLELKTALNDGEAAALGEEVVQVVHAAIGSAVPHINVIIRHGAGTRIVEAGGVHDTMP